MSHVVDPVSAAFRSAGPPLWQRLVLNVFGNRIVPARWKLRVVVAAMAGLGWLLLAPDPWIVFRLFSPDFQRMLHQGVSDKLHHFLGYLTLALCCIWYAAAESRRTFMWTSTAAAVHAVSSELLQMLVPERTVDPGDVAANSAGVAAGIGAGLIVRRMLRSGSQTVSGNTGGTGEISPPSAAAVPGNTSASDMPVTGRAQTAFHRLIVVLASAGLVFSSVFAFYGWQMRRSVAALIDAGERRHQDADFGRKQTAVENSSAPATTNPSRQTGNRTGEGTCRVSSNATDGSSDSLVPRRTPEQHGIRRNALHSPTDDPPEPGIELSAHDA